MCERAVEWATATATHCCGRCVCVCVQMSLAVHAKSSPFQATLSPSLPLAVWSCPLRHNASLDGPLVWSNRGLPMFRPKSITIPYPCPYSVQKLIKGVFESWQECRFLWWSSKLVGNIWSKHSQQKNKPVCRLSSFVLKSLLPLVYNWLKKCREAIKNLCE